MTWAALLSQDSCKLADGPSNPGPSLRASTASGRYHWWDFKIKCRWSSTSFGFCITIPACWQTNGIDPFAGLSRAHPTPTSRSTAKPPSASQIFPFCVSIFWFCFILSKRWGYRFAARTALSFPLQPPLCENSWYCECSPTRFYWDYFVIFSFFEDKCHATDVLQKNSFFTVFLPPSSSWIQSASTSVSSLVLTLTLFFGSFFLSAKCWAAYYKLRNADKAAKEVRATTSHLKNVGSLFVFGFGSSPAHLQAPLPFYGNILSAFFWCLTNINMAQLHFFLRVTVKGKQWDSLGLLAPAWPFF